MTIWNIQYYIVISLKKWINKIFTWFKYNWKFSIIIINIIYIISVITIRKNSKNHEIYNF